MSLLDSFPILSIRQKTYYDDLGGRGKPQIYTTVLCLDFSLSPISKLGQKYLIASTFLKLFLFKTQVAKHFCLMF